MAFETLTSASGVVWRRSSVLRQAGIPHAFSTRCGGVSPAPFASLNLGLADAPGDPDTWDRVRTNWGLAMQAFGMQDRVLVRARQVHGVGVIQADRDAGAVRAEPPFADGDALLTGDPAQAVSVRVADCAPVLLADPEARLVAAVHAGWRGVVGGVVSATMRALVGRGARPDRMVAAVGPCIGRAAFEVGLEVVEAFVAAGLSGHALVVPETPGKGRADLQGAIRQQLQTLGLRGAAIDSATVCTLSTPESEFSFRREGARSGRMAAIIGL